MASPEDTLIWRRLAVSAALHGAVALVLWLIPPPTRLEPLREPGIAVEIVALPAAALSRPAPPAVVTEAPSDAAPAALPDVAPAPASPEPPVLSSLPTPSGPAPRVKADRLYSSRSLADARSRKALLALRQLVPEDRIIQLCNVEAMEQVHVWKPEFKPDLVIAYAMADPVLAGLTLNAEGGALRSGRDWYRIGFACAVSADLETVTAFDFSLGERIPETEWAAHFLTAGDPAD